MDTKFTYHREGDYLIPDMTPPPEPKIGVWGRRRMHYLQQHKEPIYTGMLLNGTLNAHLEEIDKQAEEMLDLLMEQMASREGITEKLKVENQLTWAQKMNSIQNRAEEIILTELIYCWRGHRYGSANSGVE